MGVAISIDHTSSTSDFASGSRQRYLHSSDSCPEAPIVRQLLLSLTKRGIENAPSIQADDHEPPLIVRLYGLLTSLRSVDFGDIRLICTLLLLVE